MAEPNGNLSGLPQWARVVALVGVPSAIALFLVYSLASFATAGITELHRQMDGQAQVLMQHEATTSRNADALLRVLLRVCINTAKTTEDQQRCVGER